jgi:HlyD family secretion protein
VNPESDATAEERAQPISIRIASALFEIEGGEPSRYSRIVLKTVCVLFALLLIWALAAKLDIVAVAQGRLVPQTYVKIVQPADAGVIREILVEEGDRVTQGQVLIRLDPTLNIADAVALKRELQLHELQLRRIEAELAGKAMERKSGDDRLLFAQVDAQRASHRQSFLDTIAQQKAVRDRAIRDIAASNEALIKLETTLPSYQKTAAAYEKLARDDLVGDIQAEEKRREAVEKSQDLKTQRETVASLRAALSEAESKLAQIKSDYESELAEVRVTSLTEKNRIEQQLAKVNYQQGLLELRAPQDGTVKDLATTTIGAVVQPGTVLLSLVPQDEPLLAEVSIENKDIGFVAPNQTVRVKLAAYPFQKYGMLEGVVKTVSADSSTQRNERPGLQATEEQQPLAFKALIELKDQKVAANDLNLPLAAGMQVSAEIVEGKRTVMEYLLSPVQRVASEAGMER